MYICFYLNSLAFLLKEIILCVNKKIKFQPDPIENWHGKWFPHAPKELNRDSSSGNPDTLPEELKDDKHGVAMGIPHVECDNAKVLHLFYFMQQAFVILCQAGLYFSCLN